MADSFLSINEIENIWLNRINEIFSNISNDDKTELAKLLTETTYKILEDINSVEINADETEITIKHKKFSGTLKRNIDKS